LPTNNLHNCTGIPKIAALRHCGNAFALWLFVIAMLYEQAFGMILMDELVKLKDHEFDRLLDISEDELKFSNGWITNYKKQNSLH
ncbi:19884_t:CDS:2, partial [Gigaspora margarita]